jgi:hypothetical protein
VGTSPSADTDRSEDGAADICGAKIPPRYIPHGVLTKSLQPAEKLSDSPVRGMVAEV